MRNFAINNIYLYDRIAQIKKNTLFSKRVFDFLSTLYVLMYLMHVFKNFILKSGLKFELTQNCFL